MEQKNDNASDLRPDEKRSRLPAIVFIVVAAVFIAMGFIGSPNPIIGSVHSQYEFNRAVVTNNDDALQTATTTQKNSPASAPTTTAPATEKKNDKKTTPPKEQKKDANYCPT